MAIFAAFPRRDWGGLRGSLCSETLVGDDQVKLKLLTTIAASALLASAGAAWAQPSEAGPGAQEGGDGNQSTDDDVIDADVLSNNGNDNGNNNDSSDNSDNSVNDSGNADVDAFSGDGSDNDALDVDNSCRTVGKCGFD